MDTQILGGRLWWIFMALMATVNWTMCLFISPDSSPRGMMAERASLDEEQGLRREALTNSK